MIFTCDLLFVKLKSIIVFPLFSSITIVSVTVFTAVRFCEIFCCGCLVQQNHHLRSVNFWRKIHVFRRSGGGNTTREPTWPKFSADPFRGQGGCWRSKDFFHPGKINGWNLQPSPMNRKEHDLNRTSRELCSMLIFRGVAWERFWRRGEGGCFGKKVGGGEF